MDIFEEIIRLRREGKRAALATIVHTNGSIPSYESSRMLVREDGSIAGTIGGGCVEAEVWAAAKEVIKVEAPRKMVFNLNNEASYDNGLICGGTLEIFVEPILPQPMLYIFGGGHVSIALASAASAAGFAIGVVDDREAFANAQRFPMAHEIYTTYEDAFDKIKPNASTFITSFAAAHTSASTHPPPMVPAMEPSSRTSIRELSKLGIEPLVWTMVARAARLPCCRSRTISSNRSMTVPRNN